MEHNKEYCIVILFQCPNDEEITINKVHYPKDEVDRDTLVTVLEDSEWWIHN